MTIVAAVFCPRCGWLQHDDGSCARCEQLARRTAGGRGVVAPRRTVPSHETWGREAKAWLFREYLRVLAVHGADEAELEQKGWEKILLAVAQDLGTLNRRLAVDPLEAYRALATKLPNLLPPAPGDAAP